jgi:hypothetical protein
LNIAGSFASAGTVSASSGLIASGTSNVGALNVSGKLTAAAVQTSYGTFSINGTGSDTNLVSISIPNPTTTQRTTIDINYSHANFDTNVYQGYFLINGGDSMLTNLWRARANLDSGFVVQDNSVTEFAPFATDVLEDSDVHLRLDIYKRLSSRCIMEVSCEYSYAFAGSPVPTKVTGSVSTTSTNIDISSITLRTSTSSGKLVAGSYTTTQTGVA